MPDTRRKTTRTPRKPRQKRSYAADEGERIHDHKRLFDLWKWVDYLHQHGRSYRWIAARTSLGGKRHGYFHAIHKKKHMGRAREIAPTIRDYNDLRNIYETFRSFVDGDLALFDSTLELNRTHAEFNQAYAKVIGVVRKIINKG